MTLRVSPIGTVYVMALDFNPMEMIEVFVDVDRTEVQRYNMCRAYGSYT